MEACSRRLLLDSVSLGVGNDDEVQAYESVAKQLEEELLQRAEQQRLMLQRNRTRKQRNAAPNTHLYRGIVYVATAAACTTTDLVASLLLHTAEGVYIGPNNCSRAGSSPTPSTQTT